jgi:Family of unknown function (DUF5719)
VRRPFATRGWALVASAVVLSAGATAFASSARPTEPTAPGASTVAVTSSLRLCPTAAQATPDTVTYLSAASLPDEALPAPAPASAPGSDGVRLTPLSGASAPFGSLTTAGSQTTYLAGATGLTKPTALRAQGALAPGAAVSQVTYIPSGARRALIGTACTAPTGNAWFVGGSGDTGRLTTVELDNPDSTPAVADVLVYGEHGPVQAPAGRGVAVPPHGSTILRVDVLAPGTSRAALHVILREGRAAVTVTDEQASGLIAKGTDVVPETAAPARRVVIAGVPGGLKGTRTLEILAPGDQDALVQVQVLGRDGRFTPDNLAALDVHAGEVAQAQLQSQVGDGSVGLLITSDMPVVASVRNVLPSAKSTPDVTYSVATRSLRVPVLAPGLQTGTGWASRLFVAAPSTDARATITVISPDGTLQSTDVVIPGGESREYVLTGPQRFTALVTPAVDGGALFAAVYLQIQDHLGTLVTQWPLTGTSLTETLPAVVTDPALGVPGD